LQHEALGAVDHIGSAVAARGRSDVGEIVTRLPLEMGEGEAEDTLRDFWEELRAHRFAATEPNEAAGENDGGEIRLERERPADPFHHDHGLDRPAARAAILFVERQAEEAKLGIALPQPEAPAARLLHEAPPRLERIKVGEQPLHAILQNLLLFAQRKVHV